MIALVKTLVLLAIAFFVAITAQKVKPKELKFAANLLAITMCVVAGLMIIANAYMSLGGGGSLKVKCPIMRSMCRK